MPTPKQRSRSLRRVQRRIATKTVLRYEKKKPGKAKCGSCGAILQGVPRELVHKMRNMPKTKKRPERPYGGVLCSGCTRERILEKVYLKC